ncbi:MAG: hypothetical protein GX606_06415 [Elusimicrobia bacterium]|nr:hypothetical protein [Elusimicrobiota bacterium]
MNETLIYQGRELALFATPLNSYFDQDHPPYNFQDSQQTCTGEWKGYHGTWELKDDALYLVSLQGPCPHPGDPDLFTEKIFHRVAPIEAVWVTAELRAAYEDKTLVLTIERGKKVKEEIVSGSPYLQMGPYDIPTFE